MSKNTWESATRDYFDDVVIDDPEHFRLAYQVARNLNRKFYQPDWLVNAIFQKWERNQKVDPVEGLEFANIWTALGMQDVFVCRIWVGVEPAPDREGKEMNQRLKQSLAPNFFADFQGGTSDQDGVFGWHDWDNKIFNPSSDHTHLFEGQQTFPLEVGLTSVFRTMGHLKQERRLARWAYGDKSITIIQVANPNLWRLGIG